MVLQKLHEIMKLIGHVQKDMKVEMGQKGSYTVTSEAAVLKKIRPLLIEANLILIPEEIIRLERVGSVTTLGMKYRMTDVSDNDSIIISSVGQGSSTGDKAAGMAMTYAGKYALLKPLLMVTNDDPDQVGDHVHDEEASKNEALAIKLAQEVSALISGKMITPEIGNGMIKYLEENKNDPTILRDAEKQLNEMKGPQNGG